MKRRVLPDGGSNAGIICREYVHSRIYYVYQVTSCSNEPPAVGAADYIVKPFPAAGLVARVGPVPLTATEHRLLDALSLDVGGGRRPRECARMNEKNS